MRKKQVIEVNGRELAISNLEKVYFPEGGFTKVEVIKFLLRHRGRVDH